MRSVCKVVVSGETIADLTNDTVSTSTLKSGVTATSSSGETITGTSTFSSSVSVEHKVFTASNGGKVYATCSDGLISVNTAAKMVSPTGSNYSIGSMPSSWNCTNARGAAVASTFVSNAESMKIESGNLYFYPTLSSSGSIVSAYGLFISNVSAVKHPSGTSKWAWSSTSDNNGKLKDSSTITALKFGSFVYLQGGVTFSSSQSSGSWVTIATLPSAYIPAVDFGVPYTYGLNQSAATDGTSLNGAVLADGSIQILTDSISAATAADDEPVINFTCVYPTSIGTQVS